VCVWEGGEGGGGGRSGRVEWKGGYQDELGCTLPGPPPLWPPSRAC
jgi:hypothetical protein